MRQARGQLFARARLAHQEDRSGAELGQLDDLEESASLGHALTDEQPADGRSPEDGVHRLPATDPLHDLRRGRLPGERKHILRARVEQVPGKLVQLTVGVDHDHGPVPGGGEAERGDLGGAFDNHHAIVVRGATQPGGVEGSANLLRDGV